MYHFIVARIVRGSFRGLSRGDYTAATRLMAERCRYRFVGRHALGGERRTRAAIERWFQRFLRLLPGFQFVPERVLVGGWPWRTTVMTLLRVSWKKPDGTVYENLAMQTVTLRWFRAVDIVTVDDSQAVAALLGELHDRYDLAEAVAAPIEG